MACSDDEYYDDNNGVHSDDHNLVDVELEPEQHSDRDDETMEIPVNNNGKKKSNKSKKNTASNGNNQNANSNNHDSTGEFHENAEASPTELLGNDLEVALGDKKLGTKMVDIMDGNHVYIVKEKFDISEALINWMLYVLKFFYDLNLRDKGMTKLMVTIDGKEELVKVEVDTAVAPIRSVAGWMLSGVENRNEEQVHLSGQPIRMINLFSKSTLVEIVDTNHGRDGRKLKLSFEKGYDACDEELVALTPEEKDHGNKSTITVEYDPTPFEIVGGMHDQLVRLYTKNVHDVAGTMTNIALGNRPGEKLQVFFSNSVDVKPKLLVVRSFADYIELYPDFDRPKVYTVIGDDRNKFEICIGISDGNGLQQVSFVNATHLFDGARATEWILDELVPKIQEHIEVKWKTVVSLKAIRDHMTIAVNCFSDSPSIAEGKLISPELPDDLEDPWKGNRFELPKQFENDVLKCGIVQSVLDLPSDDEDDSDLEIDGDDCQEPTAKRPKKKTSSSDSDSNGVTGQAKKPASKQSGCARINLAGGNKSAAAKKKGNHSRSKTSSAHNERDDNDTKPLAGGSAGRRGLKPRNKNTISAATKSSNTGSTKTDGTFSAGQLPDGVFEMSEEEMVADTVRQSLAGISGKENERGE